MIGFDWGTTSLRVYRLGPGGRILDRREAPLGVSRVEPGTFAEACAQVAGDWLRDDPVAVLSGMVGSRQGWREVPYVACPADAAAIAAGAVAVDLPAGARGHILPGVLTRGTDGVPDVMRGEETQIVGLLAEAGIDAATVCLPGTHSKWVSVSAGLIRGFQTFFTGELFDLIGKDSMLARVFTDGPMDDAAFAAGFRRSAAAGGLLHHIFGIRASILTGDLVPAAGRSFLSGLLIGHEARSAPGDGLVHIIGGEGLSARYARALDLAGRPFAVHGEAVTARGLWEIGSRIR